MREADFEIYCDKRPFPIFTNEHRHTCRLCNREWWCHKLHRGDYAKHCDCPSFESCSPCKEASFRPID